MFSVIFSGACSRPRSVAVFWENWQEDFGPFSPECVLCYPKLCILYHLLACFSFPWPILWASDIRCFGHKDRHLGPSTARGHGTGWTRSLGGFVSPLFYTFHVGRWSQCRGAFFFLRWEMLFHQTRHNFHSSSGDNILQWRILARYSIKLRSVIIIHFLHSRYFCNQFNQIANCWYTIVKVDG